MTLWIVGMSGAGKSTWGPYVPLTADLTARAPVHWGIGDLVAATDDVGNGEAAALLVEWWKQSGAEI